jgi:adenylate cyclase
VPAGGHTAEVDVYTGRLAGLIVVEVEFSTRQEAEEFEPPAWFGDELTGDPRWSNAALAAHGKPE